MVSIWVKSLLLLLCCGSVWAQSAAELRSRFDSVKQQAASKPVPKPGRPAAIAPSPPLPVANSPATEAAQPVAATTVAETTTKP